ncbi:MAG: lytic transglycosylase domain-containing protein [Bryobacteraceae bacterium]|jgi:soluble lytic murein transglycosylase-like protein
MRIKQIRLIVLGGLSAIPVTAAAQQPAHGTDAAMSVRQRMEISISRQAAAAHAMESSIERQKAAIQRREGGRTEGFFDMPGPVGLAGGPPPVCDPLPAPEIESLVQAASDREGVDADLIRDVMKEESAFKPCAVSPKGAMGLMQLMPMTAGDLGVSNPFDPEENVTAGTQFLKRLMLRYGGDLALTLGAYNAGPSRVERSLGASKIAVPEIPETVDYVRDILSLFLGQKRLLSPALLKSASEPQQEEEVGN